jgi:hypothetical protein
LAVPAVDEVAGGEHPVDAGMGGVLAARHDIAAGVEVNQPHQQFRVRSLTDGHEHCGEVKVVLGGGVRPAYSQPGHAV